MLLNTTFYGVIEALGEDWSKRYPNHISSGNILKIYAVCKVI